MATKTPVSISGKVVAIVTIIALAGAMAFIFFSKFFKDRLDIDVFKLTYQFLLLVVIGGAVSLLFTLYVKTREDKAKQTEKEKTKENEERALQRKFYNDFTQAWNNVKKIRRFLRARARILFEEPLKPASIFIKTVQYDELVKELTVEQLKFEFFCDEVKSNGNLFSYGNKSGELLTNLKAIEEYLGGMVSEYEDCFRAYPNQSFPGDITKMPLSSLPKVEEFVEKYNPDSDFEKKLRNPAKIVSGILLNMLTSE